MRKRESTSTGRPASTSACPPVVRWTTRPWRATSTSHPGSRPSSTKRSSRPSMRASRSASNPTSAASTSTFSPGTTPVYLVTRRVCESRTWASPLPDDVGPQVGQGAGEVAPEDGPAGLLVGDPCVVGDRPDPGELGAPGLEPRAGVPEHEEGAGGQVLVVDPVAPRDVG